MQTLKTLLLGFLFFGVLGNASQAQTNTLNEFSITVQRSGVRAADVVLRGNNFEIVGSYIYDYTPRACYPCSQAQSPSFSGIFGLSSIYNPSGYINGTFYPKVYLGGSL